MRNVSMKIVPVLVLMLAVFGVAIFTQTSYASEEDAASVVVESQPTTPVEQDQNCSEDSHEGDNHHDGDDHHEGDGSHQNGWDMCLNIDGWQDAVPTGYTQTPDDMCVTATPENTYLACNDGIDNDNDQLIDLEDPECAVYQPTITITKHLINDNGCTKTFSDFLFHSAW